MALSKRCRPYLSRTDLVLAEIIGRGEAFAYEFALTKMLDVARMPVNMNLIANASPLRLPHFSLSWRVRPRPVRWVARYLSAMIR
jgi:hypothetical protein